MADDVVGIMIDNAAAPYGAWRAETGHGRIALEGAVPFERCLGRPRPIMGDNVQGGNPLRCQNRRGTLRLERREDRQGRSRNPSNQTASLLYVANLTSTLRGRKSFEIVCPKKISSEQGFIRSNGTDQLAESLGRKRTGPKYSRDTST